LGEISYKKHPRPAGAFCDVISPKEKLLEAVERALVGPPGTETGRPRICAAVNELSDGK